MPATNEPPLPDCPPEPVRGAEPPGALPPEAEPLGFEPVPTGHPGVDAGLARLEALDGAPAEAHVAVYEDVHQRLVDTLAALDQE
ncbi:hypothetical protein ACIQI7_37180 [Kitasatospora sp. NPDC092039]|uniref:hypothetical protein n=1 Tax=Kitasatospora sp. NPDC092039 TaxID=3364086 RepID=UPI00380B3072